MREDKLLLLDILFAAQDIREFIGTSSEEEFSQDRMLQSAVIRQLEIIGEAARYVTQPTKDIYPQIPWHMIMGMRNRLIHAYFEIRLDLVWETTQNDIPILIKQLEEITAPPDKE
jgi:uncharacterized protein with HEPN domain